MEEGWEIVHDKYDLNSALIVLSATLNDGPEEKVISEVKRDLRVITPGFKGALFCIPDYFSKIEWMDAYIWACNKFGKYPINKSKL